jgi:hypothetical protein
MLICAMTMAVSVPAMADQCVWNKKPVTAKAVDILNHTKLIQEYCVACGEKTATPIVVKSVSTGPTDDPDMLKTMVNGDEIDLAYIFVPKPKNAKVWTNLGLLAQCDDASNIDTKELPAGFATTP